MSPRKNSLLPYVSVDKNGRLTYERRISPDLRVFAGGKACIRRTLQVNSDDINDPNLLTAYASVHSEVNALIARWKAEAAQADALMQVDSSVIRAGRERFALSKRDIAGIAGQVLLDIRASVEKQTDPSTEFQQALKALMMKFKSQGISAISVSDFAVLARPSLDQLNIDPTPADLEAIGAALLRYIPVMQADMEKLQSMDFSPPQLQEIAPSAPARQVTWERLFQEWRQSTGGVLEEDGYGVSKGREKPYLVSIKEFMGIVSCKPPVEITIAEGREYIDWLQNESGLAPRTQANRLGCMRNLFKIGVQKGLLDSNPLISLKISTPAGLADEQGYRPFTKEELISIFKIVKREKTFHYGMLPYILICTGCRLGEALQLRTTDIKRTDSGTWYIDWRHEPTAALPMLLKTKAQNNRQCPMHPRLIQTGLQKMQSSTTKRIFDVDLVSASYSTWFKFLLQDLELWEKKKTVLHSLRGSARDLWREAGIPQDFRNALTGHQSKEIGESSYGEGLRSMPDVVYKELIKVKLDWLP